MKNLKKIIPFLFPFLIIVFGFILYNILEYEPNIYTIILNISFAYILSPKFIKISKQNGVEEQMKWLFLKKVINTKP